VTQSDLNRAVARLTGESVGHIARLGFGLLAVPERLARARPQRRRKVRRHDDRGADAARRLRQTA
jgi:hypothetical protein